MNDQIFDLNVQKLTEVQQRLNQPNDLRQDEIRVLLQNIVYVLSSMNYYQFKDNK